MRLFIEFSTIESAMVALESLKGFEVIRKEGTLPDDVIQMLPVEPVMSIQTQPVPTQAPAFETPAPVNYTAAPTPNPVLQSPIPSSGFYSPDAHGGMPQQFPQMQQQTVPVQQPAAPMTAVPTEAPSYTMEQLAVAATQIADAGRRQDLINLLNGFGVQALTMLPKEHYGAFATQLRAMGARI